MGSRNLVICDQEQEYAAAFAAYLMKKKELAFQVQVCGDLDEVRQIRDRSGIDVLVVSDRYPEQDRCGVEARSRFILAESPEYAAGEGEIPIYRYQSAETILAEIINGCSKGDHLSGVFLKRTRSKEIQIIGIFSPCHRCGKTSYALEMGKELAKDANVLYLNMETYGGIGGYFPEDGHTLADALYYSRQESKDLGLVMTTLVKHMENLDYLLPMRVSEDIKSVGYEDWVSLIHQLTESSIYDVLVLDIDESLQEVYKLLRVCTEIYVPTFDDIVSRAKVFQFEEELHLLGYDDVRRRIHKKELKL